jgi:hypothetical protein
MAQSGAATKVDRPVVDKILVPHHSPNKEIHRGLRQDACDRAGKWTSVMPFRIHIQPERNKMWFSSYRKLIRQADSEAPWA